MEILNHNRRRKDGDGFSSVGGPPDDLQIKVSAHGIRDARLFSTGALAESVSPCLTSLSLLCRFLGKADIIRRMIDE